MVFNNGAVIDFDIIKANKELAVKEISEGNLGLERLMNYCVDKDIRTIASCGDDSPYISFELNDNSRNLLFSLVRKIQSDQKLFYVAIPNIKILDGVTSCSFHYALNQYGIDETAFFDLILGYFINYSIDEKIDIEEFKYSEKLLETLSKFGLDANIEYFEIKKYSNDKTELSQYKVTIYGDDRDYILDTISKNYPKLIYSSENNDYIINMKFYEIMNFDDLKDSCDIAIKKTYTRKKF